MGGLDSPEGAQQEIAVPAEEDQFEGKLVPQCGSVGTVSQPFPSKLGPFLLDRTERHPDFMAVIRSKVSWNALSPYRRMVRRPREGG